MKNKFIWPVLILITFFLIILNLCTGSISIDFFNMTDTAHQILFKIRLPRLLAVIFTGASLSLAGVAMQGLLKNPMADGSTLGVSSGASLGAVLSILAGIKLCGFFSYGITVSAILFAFFSFLLVIFLSYKIDSSISNNTIILIGIVFSMFSTSLISFCITFAGSKANTITFWTMGSLAASSYNDVMLLGISFFLCGLIIFRRANELNAFSLGEETAFNIGINVKKVKLEILIAVSILTGVCVSVGGTIGFIGLITPHIASIFTGPNHKKLIPVTVFTGADLLLAADLISRTIVRPKELPLGVVTSFFGAIVFIYILFSNRRGRN